MHESRRPGARRRLIVSAGAAMVAFGSVVLGTGTASADPGFCGVRFDQVYGGESVYVVYNKCDRPWGFRVWLPSARRYAYAGNTDGACVVVPPHGRGYFADGPPDPNWQVHNC